MPSGIYADGEYLAPWCNVSHVSRDKVVFYARRGGGGCLPCSAGGGGALERYELVDFDDTPFERISTLGWNFTNGRSVLIIVNPSSGTGRSAAIAHVAVVDILKEAGVLLEHQETQFRGHARDIVSSLPADALRSYDAILSVGGDGTFREVVDGLVTAASAAGIPLSEAPAVAVIPSGSGNAIAASIGVTCAISGALNVVHALRIGKKSPLCLLSFVGANTPQTFAIGGVQWGAIADLDMGTEHLRWMGKTRFDVGALGCILRKKPVSGTIRVTLHPMRHESTSNQIAYLRGKHMGAIIPPREMCQEEETVLLEGEFTTIVAWAAPFISMDAKFCPFASVTDAETFDVVVIRANLSRIEMLDMMQSVENGSFVTKSTRVEYFKATKLEFEHITGEYLTVDGEPELVEPFTLSIAPESGKLQILNAMPFDPQQEFQ